jgi:DNA-directed RNA polymerase subunit K/omega
MKFNNTGAQKSTVTRDVNDFLEKTDNIFKAVSIMAKRSAQINEKMKEELMEKLEEFALTQEQLDEVFENQEQIAVSKFYESLPKPWAIAMKELLNDEIYMREADVEQEEDVDESKQDA